MTAGSAPTISKRLACVARDRAARIVPQSEDCRDDARSMVTTSWEMIALRIFLLSVACRLLRSMRGHCQNIHVQRTKGCFRDAPEQYLQQR